MINSIKSRILAWFILFSMLLLTIISLLNYNYYKKREINISLIERFEYLENKLLRTFNNSNAFFRNEINNPVFFETGNSKFITQNKKLNSEIEKELSILKEISLKQKFDVNKEIETITEQTYEFNKTFNQIVELIQKRGYKDYGTVGKMRHQIHKLEKTKDFNAADMLMLRRHEKDYIIRNEEQYVEKLNKLAESFTKDISSSPELNKVEKDSLIHIIAQYTSLFNQVVLLDKSIGIRNNSALKRKLDDLETSIYSQIDKVLEKAKINKTILLNKARQTYIFEVIIAILLSFLFSYLIIQRLTNPLTQLTAYISKHKNGEAPIEKNIFNRNTDKEVWMIFNEFNNMIAHLEKRQKQRDNALKEIKIQEKRFRQMANLLPISLFETDKDLKLTYINKKFIETFNIQIDDLENLYLFDLLRENDLQYEILRNKNLNTFETRAYSINNNKIPVLVYCAERIVNNESLGIRGIIIDITERIQIIEDLKKAKSKAEESDKLKSAFLANMSHEIRTPMNSIIGFSELLSDYIIDNEKAKMFIQQIKNSGKLLLDIIDDIIDISKIEVGKIEIRKEKIQLNEILDEIYFDFLNIVQINNSSVSLILEKGTNNNISLTTDVNRLKQILINLISNALKFTSEGHIRFGYKIQNDVIQFFVHDTGIGISDDKLDLIFERFRQADDTINRKYGGTGLGLTITKKLVELMGGNIYAESENGKGSSFYFTMPEYEIICISDETENTKHTLSNKIPNWENYKILIVEDDYASQLFLKEIVRDTKIEIFNAEDGKTAIEIVKEKNIDIILMDIHLPIMNGYTATREIKKIDSSIPIIAQTAYAMADEKNLCLEAGCNDYISKPIKRDELLGKILKYINVKRARIDVNSVFKEN